MSISKKLALWIISIALTIATLSAYIYYRVEIADEAERFSSLGKLIGELVEENIRHYMLTKDFAALEETMNALKKTGPISNLFILNDKGIVKSGTDKETLGREFSYTDTKCRGCHGKGQQGFFFKKEKIYRWVQPVTNRPECYKCHSSSVKYNGIILIDFSLIELEKHLREDILKAISIFIPSIVIIGLIMIFLSREIVIKRLNHIIANIVKFKGGDYEVRMSLERNDEITKLEEKFNEMAKAIQERNQEKDILFKQISSSYKMWQDTFDSITDLISIHDEEFNIIKANKAFAEYFGFHPRDIVNKKCYEIFHGADFPIEICPHVTTLRENKPAIAEVSDPGTNKIFRVSTFPFVFPETTFKGTIHIANDITDEKEKEMKLIMSDRLAALGQMASGIAHEINNPLASIAGCAEGLLSRVKNEKYDRTLFENYLKIIEEEISRCKNITITMLSFVRDKTYEKRDVDLREALDRTIEIIGFQGRLKNIQINRIYEEGIPFFHGSEGELRQVFTALITNAIDAMQDKGILTLETGSEGKMIFVKISDSGKGIPHDNLSRIFTPFFTTKSDKGGTGLGLPIANRIVTENKGTITVVSSEGKGTTFKITLPSQ